MRIIHTEEIISNIRQMCIEANHMLTPDMQKALECAVADEKSPIGQKVLGQLQDNLQIAQEDTIPICQDTGMAVVFLEIGQDVHFEGGSGDGKRSLGTGGNGRAGTADCTAPQSGNRKSIH